VAAGAAGVAVLGLTGLWLVHRNTLLREDFDAGKGLISNEFAFHNPRDPRRVTSPDWEVTSGSFFRDRGEGWTGSLDSRPPDPRSATSTNSDVFRALTRRQFGDVAVSMRLRLDSPPGGGDADWAGVNLFLRYHDEFTLYAVSVARRDGVVAIKKKLPGGISNGGTYATLAQAVHPLSVGGWHTIRASVVDVKGTVTMSLSIDGVQVLRTSDGGVGGEPLTGTGRVGLRGDYTEFHVDDFVVTRA
jgi:hypothetical protein